MAWFPKGELSETSAGEEENAPGDASCGGEASFAAGGEPAGEVEEKNEPSMPASPLREGKPEEAGRAPVMRSVMEALHPRVVMENITPRAVLTSVSTAANDAQAKIAEIHNRSLSQVTEARAQISEYSNRSLTQVSTATSALSDMSTTSLEGVTSGVNEAHEIVSSRAAQVASDTKEGSQAMGDYARRVWRVSNFWRTPPPGSSNPSEPSKGSSSTSADMLRILIVFSDTGGGHKASANSLKAALEHTYPGRVQVMLRDIMEEFTIWPSHRMYNYWSSIPWLWGAIYNSTKKTHSLTGNAFLLDPSRVFEPSVLEGFIRCTQEEQPDVIISVHPFYQSAPRTVTSHFKNGQHIPFATVVTDLGEAHPWWFNPQVDKLFVPTQQMRDQALEFGLSESQIEVVGLPLRQGFWQVDPSEQNRATLRAKLELAADTPVVLVIGGGDGMGKLSECALSFIGTKDPGNSPQVVVICGNNAVLRKSLQTAVDKREGEFKVAPRVLGFVSNMDEWMLASDVLVTKAGPGSIAEACCCALPILLFDYLAGQEEGNVKFVEEGGMGQFIKDATQSAQVCKDWLADPALLKDLREKSLAAARPQSSLRIASLLKQLMDQSPRFSISRPASCSNEPEDAPEVGKFELRSSWWSWISPANKDRAPSWWREVPVEPKKPKTESTAHNSVQGIIW